MGMNDIPHDGTVGKDSKGYLHVYIRLMGDITPSLEKKLGQEWSVRVLDSSHDSTYHPCEFRMQRHKKGLYIHIKYIESVIL